MSIEVIEQRLSSYHCKDRIEEINALKEITQEIALMSLSRADFFKVAEFHGGTALRILYSLQRFSEDLDFALLNPIEDFDLTQYLIHIKQDFEAYGYQVEISDRKEVKRSVQKQFLKVDSLGKELSLIYPKNKSERKIKIKFELDTNPPSGATTELKYLTFPAAYSVLAKDLPSMFAGKIHALLCRPYDKGRDWYDLVWFVSNKTTINYDLLTNAINQQGPWSDQAIKVDAKWLIDELKNKILRLNWKELTEDVFHLLRPIDQAALKIWNQDFFLDISKRIHNQG